MKVFLVGGARPNFMKIAPLYREGVRRIGVEMVVVHTGQHYDYELSKSFFNELELPEPKHFLNAGSGTHAEQTARVMVAFEKICIEDRPDLVVVVGDVNSTMACAVTAKKVGIPVAHVEAGLRSRDMSMPEEINRIITDAVCDYLFVTEPSGADNLKREGKEASSLFLVGNVMIDNLHYALGKIRALSRPSYAVPPYAVLTLHRPSNVDSPDKLRELLSAIAVLSADMPVHFAVHPRTDKNIAAFGLRPLLEGSRIHVHPPLPYLEFLRLWRDASLVLTDSGGIQEETTALGVPCFTLRDNTERPITVTEGTNKVVGTTGKGLLDEWARFKAGEVKVGRCPELWDGRASVRIWDVLQSQQCLAGGVQSVPPTSAAETGTAGGMESPATPGNTSFPR